MRKLIYYLATSADGYIARPDGDVAWLDRPRPKGDYGMPEFYDSVDTVVMGRKTYDVGRRLGQPAYPGKANYVLSHSPRPADAPKIIEYVREPVPAFARRLREREGGNVWLVGGAELVAAFLDAGEVDELIVHVVPVLIGEGIPLLAPQRRALELTLLSAQPFDDGVVRLHYAVGRPETRGAPSEGTGSAATGTRAARRKGPKPAAKRAGKTTTRAGSGKRAQKAGGKPERKKRGE